MYDNDTTTETSYDSFEQHVHELVGSTLIADACKPHNHRFAVVSEEAISCKGGHIHNIRFRTDSYDGHYHEFCGTSGPAVSVGDGRHVHYASGYTSSEDGHTHRFRAASLIDNPIECNCK